jgi:hypothetical protein
MTRCRALSANCAPALARGFAERHAPAPARRAAVVPSQAPPAIAARRGGAGPSAATGEATAATSAHGRPRPPTPERRLAGDRGPDQPAPTPS